MARFTMSSFRSPLPPWHSRSIASLNCSLRTAMVPLTQNSSFCGANPCIHLASSSSTLRGREVLQRGTQVRLMRLKAGSLSNCAGLMSRRLWSFNLRDGGRGSGRLTCFRASSSSSTCRGGPKLGVRLCCVVIVLWIHCYYMIVKALRQWTDLR